MARATTETTVTVSGVPHVRFRTGGTGRMVEVAQSTGPDYTPAAIVRDHATTPTGTTFTVEVPGADLPTEVTKMEAVYLCRRGEETEEIRIPFTA